MLNNQDITLLRQLLLEQEDKLLGAMRKNTQTLKKEFSLAIKQSAEDVKRELREEIRTLISASERRITESVADLMDASILNQISELQNDVSRIKKHLTMA